MARTKQSRLRHKRIAKEGINVEEIDRLVSTRSGYVILVYDVWLGDGIEKDDPATDLERWASIFTPDVAPENGKLPIGGDSYYGFDGLDGAVSSDLIETLREADRDVQQMLEDQETMKRSGRQYDYRTNSYSDEQSTYEGFLEAIDRVAADESDEEAWNIIESWRTRKLSVDEGKAARKF